MATKRKRKKRIKTSFKLFVALFIIAVVLFTVFMCNKKDGEKQEEVIKESEQNTVTQVESPQESIEPYNDDIELKKVYGTGFEKTYVIVKNNEKITSVIADCIDSHQIPLVFEKAFYNRSCVSIVMNDISGGTVSLNYGTKDNNELKLSQVAPSLYDEYGEVPFYFDGDNVTLYTSDGQISVALSEYDGEIHFPYCPPEYTPAAEGEKVIALTFDDGPHNPKITRKILEKLRERRAKATFFVLGFECPNRGEILNEILDSGCEIGNHSWRHEKLNKISRDEALESITKTQDIVFEKTGVYPKAFRPPYGDEREDIMQELGLFHVEWCVDPEDWKHKEPQVIADHVKEKAQSGYVVLMHDIYEPSGEAALELIDYFCDNGWRLVTVSELFDFENREFTTEIFRMK